MSHQIPVIQSSFVETIKETLQTEGACIVSGIKTETAYIDFGRSIGEIYHYRDSTENGITKVSYNPVDENLSGFSGFGQDGLEFHTDRSTLIDPPAIVALSSSSVAPKGGYSLLVDGNDLCRYIADVDTEAFNLMLSSQRYIYDDRSNIYKGPMLYPLADDRYGLRFRCDGNGFYTYRDQFILNRIIQYARKFEHAFVLEQGHILIANNERWLHGRTAFQGERALMRLLLKPGSWFLRGFHIHQPTLVEAA